MPARDRGMREHREKLQVADELFKQDGGAGEQGKTEVFSIPDPAREFRLDPGTISGLHKLAHIFERMNLTDYISMVQDKRRLILNNFIAGLARGFGFSIGMSVLLALLLILMGRMVNLPLIGKYIAALVDIVQQEVKVHKF